MDHKKAEELLNQAMKSYNSGEYGEAIAIWESILKEDANNRQAQEGIRMAEVISKSWMPEGSSDAEDKVDAPDLIEIEEDTNFDNEVEERQVAVATETVHMESSDEKVHEMILEAEGLIKEKRYVEAIGKLSEAWALDETNGAVQDLTNIARSLLEMDNKKIKEKLTRAIEHFDRKKLDTAEALFKEIVSINPAHMEAFSYLEKIDQEKAKEEIARVPVVAIEGEEKSREDSDAKGLEEEAREAGEEGEGKEADKCTVHVDEVPEPVQEKVASPVRSRRKSFYSKILFIALAVLVIGSGFYFSRDIISGFLSGDGSTKTDVVSKDPGTHDKAAMLLPLTEDWMSSESRHEGVISDDGAAEGVQESEADAAVEESVVEPLSPAEIKIMVSNLLREGKTLAASGQAIEAEKKFEEAMILDPLSFEAKRLHENIFRVAAEERERKEKMDRALQLFDEENFEEALKIYYRLPDYDKEPTKRYIINSWYNQGVLYMMARNVPEAAKCFHEVLQVRPNDQDALREKEITNWYSSRRIDGSFYNHIKTLTYRKITD